MFVVKCLIQLAESCPHQCLEWLSTQVVRNKTAASWTLQHLDYWVEMYLMSYGNVRVRNGLPHILNIRLLHIFVFDCLFSARCVTPVSSTRCDTCVQYQVCDTCVQYQV